MKKFYKYLLNKLPRPLLIRLSYVFKFFAPVLYKGDKVECVVLAVDRDKRRISLSMKHLEEDPWDLVESKYPQGTETKGSIIPPLDRAVVPELEDGM